MINFWAHCYMCGPDADGNDVEVTVHTKVYGVDELPSTRELFLAQCLYTLDRPRDDLPYEVSDFGPGLVSEITLTLGCELVVPQEGVPYLQASQCGEVSRLSAF